ncbi:MAG TPA: hypothetical protein PLD47_00570 [Aggregatilineales bacterium]|nr:hypothetical protein [Anaerolineales bacterium]HRE46192.1 hypothetical protein [Aggregatilineales bacterium]
MVGSPAYHDILTDGLGGGDLKGKRTTPALLVRRLVAAQPVRVLHVKKNPAASPHPNKVDQLPPRAAV